MEDLRADLEQAAASGADHVSLYGLEWHPECHWHTEGKGSAEFLADEDYYANQYESACATLDQLGYAQYEISNFARPGFESRHNWDCWTGKPYLGFGPGAHSYVPSDRWWNLSNVKEYLEREDVVMRRETLTPEQVRIEGIFLGLRTDRGVELDRIPGDLEPYLERVGGRVRLTRAGKCVADSVIRQLL